MSLRYGQIDLTASLGPKSLSEILGVSERWTHVLINVGGSPATVFIGDSAIGPDGSGGFLGLAIHGDVDVDVDRELIFDARDNPADELFFFSSQSSPGVQLRIVAY